MSLNIRGAHTKYIKNSGFPDTTPIKIDLAYILLVTLVQTETEFINAETKIFKEKEFYSGNFLLFLRASENSRYKIKSKWSLVSRYYKSGLLVFYQNIISTYIGDVFERFSVGGPHDEPYHIECSSVGT